VTTSILTPADYPCTDARYKAGKTDGVTVNYQGRLTSDGTVFDDSFKVGRPLDFTLGTGGVIAGWETGIPGMCVGETRRLYIPAQFAYGAAGQAGKIPADAHLTFDVELLAVNGKDLTALRAEAAAEAAEEGASATDTNADDAATTTTATATATANGNGDSSDILAVRMGARDSPYCDACSTVLEEFYGSWVTTMMRQVNKAEARGGGSAPPAVTYNDDTEAMVQSFCTNRSVSQINAQPPVYVAHVKQACERIMKMKKRELVGQFLSAELDGRILPEKNAVICGEWLGACPRKGRGKNAGGKCGVCRLMVEDLAFEIRRSAPPTVSGKDAVRTRVRSHLEHVCQNAYYRRPLKRDDVDLCEDLVDDHRELILDTYIGGGGGVGGGIGGGGANEGGGSAGAWLEVARKVCVEEAEVCKPSKVTAENFMAPAGDDDESPPREDL
jgi:FK506-binding protein 2